MTWDGFTFSNAQTAPTTSEARNAWKDDFGSTTQEKGRPTRDVAVRYDSCGVRSSAASLRHGRSRNRFRVGPGPREERSSREDTIFCLHSHARKEHVRLPSGPIEPRSGSPFPKLVEPARERSERLCRNHPAPGSQNLTTVTLVSTRSARWRSQIGSTSLEGAKLVEPARERSERLCRNHRAVEWWIGPQVPGRGRFGFDSGCSFVAARLNQL